MECFETIEDIKNCVFCCNPILPPTFIQTVKIFKVLAIKGPAFPQPSEHSICQFCKVTFDKGEELLEELKRIESSLKDLRTELKVKVVSTYRKEEEDLDIRRRVFKSAKGIANKRGREEQEGNVQDILPLPESENQLEEYLVEVPPPSPLLQVTKKGRIVKRPQLFCELKPEENVEDFDPDWKYVGSEVEQDQEDTESDEETQVVVVDEEKRRKVSKAFETKPKVCVRKIPIKIQSEDGREEFDGVCIQEIKDDSEEWETMPNSVHKLTDNSHFRLRCSREEDCPKLFINETKLKMHIKRIHDGVNEPFDCLSCGKKFDSLRKLRFHAKEEHGEIPDWLKGKQKLHSCTYDDCKSQYKSKYDLLIHIRSVHTHETPYECGICTQKFISVPKREAHIEQNHPEATPHPCDQCSKGFFRETRLRDHKKTHTGEKSFLCEICSKSFTAQTYLRYHQTKHEELQLMPYKCDECGKKFATPANLRIHTSTQHKKEFRYYCEVCNHGASHKSHLRLHMRTHSGERPAVCEDCGKSFTRASQLTIHKRNHSGERPFVCGICKKTFTNSSKLRRHEQIHSQIKPFQCSMCEKKFSQHSNLNAHIKSAHSTTGKSKGGKKAMKAEEISKLDKEDQLVFPSQIITIPQQDFDSIPLQFQVVSEGIEGESSLYTEFIILNQI